MTAQQPPDVAVRQETIVHSNVDHYLDTLDEILVSGRPRAKNDPTLAVALSVAMLDLLVTEVRQSRATLRDQEQRIADLERELARCRDEPVRLLNPQMDRP